MQPVAAVSNTPILRISALLATLTIAIGLVVGSFLRQPGYTDAYYYFNAAQRIAQGKGLTDAALWTYFGLPTSLSTLPVPSHLYWMPLASLIESPLGLTFGGAKLVMLICFAGLVALASIVGWLIGRTQRTAWLAGLLTLFSGFYFPWWFNTDTFALYGVIGAGALVAMGLGRTYSKIGWWALAGVLSGLAHLTRADGLLLIGILLISALWPQRPQINRIKTIRAAAIGLIAYGLIMSPWFIRNLSAVGSILPIGGVQTAWMRSYDQIDGYPPGVSLNDFWAWGISNIVGSRIQALTLGAQTLIAVEGWIVLTPFMLFALWRRRADPFLSAFILYAIGLHAAMTLIFAFPGERGALFHSATALLPFWAALGAIGLDGAISWAARRRHWPLTQSKTVFGAALIGYAIVLSGIVASRQFAGWNANGALYRQLAGQLPANAVVMVNDPPAFYYQTGLSAIVVPDNPPDVIPTLAAKYGVTHLILDVNRTVPMNDLYFGNTFPAFLKLIYDHDGVRIFEIVR